MATSQPVPEHHDPDSGPVEAGIAPDQALAAIALGLLQRRATAGSDQAWIWNGEADTEAADLLALRRRLEAIQLALQTGAPLSTAEVTRLLGARPGAAEVERGGLIAQRLGRNVWKLSPIPEGRERSGGVVQFSEGFRRRL